MIGPSAVGAPPRRDGNVGELLHPGHRGEGAAPTQLAAKRAEMLYRDVKQNDQSQIYSSTLS
jgi:hypothetical protein